MSRAGRNDPCPCGSGSKFKRCCLERHEEVDRVHDTMARALGLAADWFDEHHEEELAQLLGGGYFSSLGERAEEMLAGVDEDERHFIENNAVEWAVAEGTIEVDGVDELLLSRMLADPQTTLAPAERGWLEEVVERPLHLYEVEEVEPAKGFRVRDLIVPDTAAIYVEDPDAIEELEEAVLGLRLVGGGPWYATGALYPFPQEEGKALAQDIGAELLQAEDDSSPRELVSAWLIEAWLEGVVEELFDDGEGIGEEEIEVVDFYAVDDDDWESLEATFEAREDIALIDDESGWVWVVPEEDGGVRVRVAIYRNGDGDLALSGAEAEVDASRAWLAEVSSGRARFRERID